MSFSTEISGLTMTQLMEMQEDISNRIKVVEEEGKVFSDLVGRRIFRSLDKLEFFKILKVNKEDLLGVTASYNPSIRTWDVSTSQNPFEVNIFYAHADWWEAKARLGKLKAWKNLMPFQL